MKKIFIVLGLLSLISCKETEETIEIPSDVLAEKAINPEDVSADSTNTEFNVWSVDKLQLPNDAVGRVTAKDCANCGTEDRELKNNYIVVKNHGTQSVYRDVDVDTYLVLNIGDSIQ